MLTVTSQKDLNLPGLDEEQKGTGETETVLTLSCLFVGLRDFSQPESNRQKEGCTDRPLILRPFTKLGEMTLSKCLHRVISGEADHRMEGRYETDRVSGENGLFFFHCLRVLIVLGTIH